MNFYILIPVTVILAVLIVLTFKKSPSYTILETRDFSCTGMSEFTFKYPVFKGWEIYILSPDNINGTCSLYLNNDFMSAIPEKSSKAPQITVIKFDRERMPNSLKLPVNESKNQYGIFYDKIENSEGYQFHALSKFTVTIELHNLTGKESFSTDAFWKTVIESFRIVNNETSDAKSKTFQM